MGGTLPLGYDRHSDPLRRELVVNAAEAETVRRIFCLYADLGNLRLVEREALRLGLQPKAGVSASGTVRGAGPFTRGQLHYLLTNPVYIGRIRHKDLSYPGQHDAIITGELWEDVQAKLIAAQARPRGRSVGSTEPRLLMGKLRDETGDVLTPSHTQRHGRRFAYYVSHRVIAGGLDPTGWRLPAAALEACLCKLVVAHLRNAAIGQRLMIAPDATGAAELNRGAHQLADQIEADVTLSGPLLVSVGLQPGRIQLQLAAGPIAAALGVPADTLSPDLLAFSQPLVLRRRGVETRIIAGAIVPTPDPVLLRTLAEAHVWARSLRAGQSLTKIAAASGHSEPCITSRIPLAFLAPNVQAAILNGCQPPDISLARFLRDGIPIDWAEQARLFANA